MERGGSGGEKTIARVRGAKGRMKAGLVCLGEGR